MQSVMESMQGLDASTFGVDPLQWQELTQSFNQILSSQGVSKNVMSNSPRSLSSNSSLSSHSGSFPGQNFINISQGSGPHLPVGSFVNSTSSGASAGSYRSATSVPGIHVTPPNYGMSRSNAVEDDVEDDFDWSSIM